MVTLDFTGNEEDHRLEILLEKEDVYFERSLRINDLISISSDVELSAMGRMLFLDYPLLVQANETELFGLLDLSDDEKEKVLDMFVQPPINMFIELTDEGGEDEGTVWAPIARVHEPSMHSVAEFEFEYEDEPSIGG